MYAPLNKLFSAKKKAKKLLAKKLMFSWKKPLLGIFLDKALTPKIEKRIEVFLNGTMALDMEVIVLTDSNLDVFSLPNIIILPYGRINRKELLEASDMALCFDFSDVEEILMNGVIPVSMKRPEVSDYDPNHETGNSFIYKQDDPWHVFAALVRARETFKFPYDWKHIVRIGLGSVRK